MVLSARLNTIEDTLENSDESKWARYVSIRDFIKPFLTWSPPSQGEALPKQYYTDHGVGHSERVIDKLNKFWKENDIVMDSYELFILLSCAWCHDLGMFLERPVGEDPEKTRQQHHIRSAQAIERLNSDLRFDRFELPIVKEVSMAHREVSLSSLAPEKRIGEAVIRVRLLAALLRIADACDIDYRRAPEAIFQYYKEMIPQISRPHWQRHFPISSVYYQRERSSIIVSVNFSADLIEYVEQYKMLCLIRKELLEELRSVREVFSYPYDIRIFHVEIQNFGNGNIIDISSLDGGDSWLLIGIDVDGIKEQKLNELSKLLNAHRDKCVLILEILPPFGPIYIKLPVKIEISPTLNGSLKGIFNDHLAYYRVEETKRKEERIITGGMRP